MKSINYNDIEIGNYISSGSFGEVYECTFNGDSYAYKKFNNKEYLNGKIRKLDMISNIEKEYLIKPVFWVNHEKQKNGYLSKLINGKDLEFTEEEDLKTKIIILKKCRDAIIDMNNIGIIHSDLSKSNIMIENGNPKFIDFDNATFNNYYTKVKDANDFQMEYIKKYGINKELDIYTFNLLTYSIINNIEVPLSRISILCNDYGLFSENMHAINICDSLFLDSDTLNTDFLIDTIDDTKLIL